MELYLMRHGHAQAEAAKDSLRELSERGHMEVEKMALKHADSFRRVDKVIASPYLRAQQSAGVITSQLGLPEAESHSQFKPNSSPDDAISLLHSLFHERAVNSILVVTHLPLVGILVDDLCGLETGRCRMGTASLAAIDVEVLARDCCTLRFLHHAMS